MKIDQNEWDGLLLRLIRIENLLIANAETDINGAPMKWPDPTAYDVLKTLQVLWGERTTIPVLRIAHAHDDGTGGGWAETEFNIGSHRYEIIVKRY